MAQQQIPTITLDNDHPFWEMHSVMLTISLVHRSFYHYYYELSSDVYFNVVDIINQASVRKKRTYLNELCNKFK